MEQTLLLNKNKAAGSCPSTADWLPGPLPHLAHPPALRPLAGATSVADPLRLSRVGNPQELLYTLVAVSHAQEPELLLSGGWPRARRGQGRGWAWGLGLG